MAITIAAQTFDALASTDTFTADTVSDGQPLTNAGSVNTGGPGLDFVTLWYDTRGTGVGPKDGSESGDFIGVNAFAGANAPDVAPDGTPVAAGTEHNFEFNDGDGRLDLVFETVDMTTYADRRLSLAWWINDTGYESTDSFTITLTDGTDTVTLSAFGETELEAGAAADDGTANWTTLTVDLEPLIAGGLDAGSLGLVVSVDTNAGSETVFLDDVAFTAGDTPPAAPVVLNELLVSHTGTDDTEFVELFGTPGTSLDGLSLISVEGEGSGAGTIDERIDFGPDDRLGDNGFYLVGNATGLARNYGVTPDRDLDPNFENGDATYALVETASLAGGVGTAVTGSEVVLDGVGLTEDDGGTFVFGVPVVGPDGPFLPAGARRVTDGVDTDTAADWALADFSLGDANTPTAGTVAPTIVINEVLASHTGADDTEFVELFGTPGASLAGLSLVAVEGTSSPGTFDDRIDFGPGDAIGANGFFLVGNAAGLGAAYGVTPDIDRDPGFENDTTTFALVETASLGDGAVVGGETVLDAVALLSPEGGEVFFGAPQVGPDGGFYPAGARRVVDGVDTDTAADWAIADFFLGPDNTPTPGGGGGGGGPTIDDDPTAISAVQGSGDTAAADGETVVIEAIVSGDFQTGDADTFRDLDGFFLMEEVADRDGDAATSEGIFVFDGALSSPLDVEEGDRVRVLGTVGERFGKTQITATEIRVVEAGAVADVSTLAVSSALPGRDAREALEGMLVAFDEPLTFVESFDYEQFGEATLAAGGEIFQYTQLDAPDTAGYAAHRQAVADRTILIDDGTNGRRADGDPILAPDGTPLSVDQGIRMGQEIRALTGIVDYDFGEFRIRLPQGESFDPDPATNPRPAAPDDVGGTLKVASYNVLNYFTTLDERGAETVPGFDPTAELERQRDKLVTAIEAIDADVLGLVEIENNGTALADLVGEVNAHLGFDRYAFVDTGVVGGDAIATAFVFDQTTVSLSGDFAVLDTAAFVDPLDTGADRNRPAIAQTFTEIASGESFTAVVNHFKSKGSLTGDPADADQGDGQGNNNATRTEAARELAAWLAGDPTGSGDADVLVLGDLNAYAMEDPITALAAAGYTDLERFFNGEETSSYRFSGEIGTLDYGLANASMLAQTTGATAWQINADEMFVFDYNIDSTFGTEIIRPQDQGLFDGADPAKNSDHDPLIIGLDLGPDFELVQGGDGNDFLVGTDGNDVITGLSGQYDRMAGGAGTDVFRVGNGTGDGVRGREVILDFTVGVDQLALAAEVATSRTIGDNLYLQLAGDDRDTVVLLGVTGLDDAGLAIA